jgi:hypothetical protein
LWRCTYLTSDLGNEWLLDPGIGTCCLVSFDWHQWKESIVIMDFFLLTIFNDIFIDSLINTCGWWDLSNLPLAFLNWQFMGDTIWTWQPNLAFLHGKHQTWFTPYAGDSSIFWPYSSHYCYINWNKTLIVALNWRQELRKYLLL